MPQDAFLDAERMRLSMLSARRSRWRYAPSTNMWTWIHRAGEAHPRSGHPILKGAGSALRRERRLLLFPDHALAKTAVYAGKGALYVEIVVLYEKRSTGTGEGHSALIDVARS